MGKYDFIKDSNIVSTHKILTLEFEKDYSGKVESFDVKVYPYTVEEKLAFKNATSEGNKLLHSKDEKENEKGQEIIVQATKEAVLSVLKKDDPDVTIDHIEKMPDSWLDKIIFKALEFEGIEREEVKAKNEKK